MQHFQGPDVTDAEAEAYNAMCRLHNEMDAKHLEIEDKNEVIQKLELTQIETTKKLKLAKIEKSQLTRQLTDLRKELRNQEKTLKRGRQRRRQRKKTSSNQKQNLSLISSTRRLAKQSNKRYQHRAHLHPSHVNFVLRADEK